VVDLMPPRDENADVVRIVEGVRGRVPMEMTMRLRFDYGSVTPWIRHRDGCLEAVAGPHAVWLRTPVALHAEDSATSARFTVSAGDRVPFVTVDAVRADLEHDGFVRRYDTAVDGQEGSEGAFLAASFWLADALHSIGSTDEATAVFERLLALRNDVGLLSEEYDVENGRHVGNTPQAFSPVGLTNTARHLTGRTVGSTAHG
jgi:GH15 family glucan-1,4-alpha-glucosidase